MGQSGRRPEIQFTALFQSILHSCPTLPQTKRSATDRLWLAFIYMFTDEIDSIASCRFLGPGLERAQRSQHLDLGTERRGLTLRLR